MDNYHAQLYHESNKRLIEAMGMHWENERRKSNGESIAYTDADFNSLAHKHLDF